jgi:hypothetical protein
MGHLETLEEQALLDHLVTQDEMATLVHLDVLEAQALQDCLEEVAQQVHQA